MADFWPTLQKMVKQENPQQTAENNNQTFNESDFISVYCLSWLIFLPSNLSLN
jgi:hypothetical protein